MLNALGLRRSRGEIWDLGHCWPGKISQFSANVLQVWQTVQNQRGTEVSILWFSWKKWMKLKKTGLGLASTLRAIKLCFITGFSYLQGCFCSCCSLWPDQCCDLRTCARVGATGTLNGPGSWDPGCGMGFWGAGNWRLAGYVDQRQSKYCHCLGSQ